MAIPGQDTPGLTFTVDTSQPPEIRMLRPMVLLAAGFLGHKEVLQRAVGLLDTQGVAGVHADVASAVFGLAVLSGDEEVYTKVQDAYIQVSKRHSHQQQSLGAHRISSVTRRSA